MRTSQVQIPDPAKMMGAKNWWTVPEADFEAHGKSPATIAVCIFLLPMHCITLDIIVRYTPASHCRIDMACGRQTIRRIRHNLVYNKVHVARIMQNLVQTYLVATSLLDLKLSRLSSATEASRSHAVVSDMKPESHLRCSRTAGHRNRTMIARWIENIYQRSIYPPSRTFRLPLLLFCCS